ncbi:hypothetical protein MPER_09938, partial [Moniliophthora perniciosa FA553]
YDTKGLVKTERGQIFLPDHTWNQGTSRKQAFDSHLRFKLEAIDYMRNKTRSFEYATLVLNSIESQIRKEIERYGGNTPLSVLVDLLTQKRK